MKELYFKNWEFNIARILDEVEKIVLQKNGVVSITDFPYIKTNEKIMIHNRTITEYECKLNEYKEALKLPNSNKEFFNTEIQKIEKKLKENESSKTRIVNHTTYINFILDGVYYYFQVDSNPLFDFYIQKYPVDYNKEKSEYIQEYNYYMMTFEKDLFNYEKAWLDFLNDKEIEKMALQLFNKLIKHTQSNIIYSKQRVNNIYNSGYHYESFAEKRKKVFKIV